RYPVDIAPFVAMRDTSPESYAALRALLGPEHVGVLFTTQALTPPAGLSVQISASGYQMVATRLPAQPSGRHDFVPLTAADAPAMQELVALTKPGPFAERTVELGTYLGVRSNGRLVAMAGERMRLAGQVEISAVCVHPEHRGHGYARDLILTLMHRQIAQGIVPMLHTFADNAPAIALYEQIGFAIRQTLHVTGLKRT
ncbi:MAG TPA: GNAT family N-acetyltransferase, partial [Bordetella sp.]